MGPPLSFKMANIWQICGALHGGGENSLSEFSGSAPDSLKIRAQYNVEKCLPGIPGVFDTIVSRGRRIW